MRVVLVTPQEAGGEVGPNSLTPLAGGDSGVSVGATALASTTESLETVLNGKWAVACGSPLYSSLAVWAPLYGSA
jgi:hypothetical protein